MPNDKGFYTRQDIANIDEQLRARPNDPALWCRRGNMIEMLDEEDSDLTLEDVEASYKKAIEIDPNYHQAYEELGYYYDRVQDDPKQAIGFYRAALALGAGKSAEEGLSEAMSQIND